MDCAVDAAVDGDADTAFVVVLDANTVKTQANAVYRRFGVACRSDAVARAHRCGLLD